MRSNRFRNRRFIEPSDEFSSNASSYVAVCDRTPVTSELRASRWLAGRIIANSTIVVSEVVLMELLFGTADESKVALRRRLLRRCPICERLAPARGADGASAVRRRVVAAATPGAA